MSTRDFGSNAKVVVVCAVIICIGIAFFSSCSGAVARGEDDSPTDLSSPSAGKTGEPTDNEPDTGARVTVSAALSDSRPSAGAHSTLSVTVRNAGEGTTAAMTLRYYQSTDATITTADREVATGTVAALAATGSASYSVALAAPATPGTYYYGACVAAVVGETDTANNCSRSVQVTVQVTVSQTQGQPDLTLPSVSVSDSRPDRGEQFTLSATVRNAGKGTADETTLRYYRTAVSSSAVTTGQGVGDRDAANDPSRYYPSTAAATATSDSEVATDTVARLAASGSSSESADLTAPLEPGAYRYRACVDTVSEESDVTNNCSESIQVNVRTPPDPPDLVVVNPSVTDNDPTVGESFTLSATVQNEGSSAAGATTLRFYRSIDVTITTSDSEVGTGAIPPLAAIGTVSASVELTAPGPPGRYYYGACVDAVTDESDTADNCSQALEVTVAAAVRESPDDDCEASTSTTCRVRIAGSITRTIETAGDRDWLLLQGQIAAGGELLKGHRFRISVEERLGSGVATTVEVLDSAGNQLSPRALDESGSGTVIVTFIASATASYYIEVAAFDPNATGAYGVLTMNTTASTIRKLEIISDPGLDNTYTVDDDIEVRVIFSSAVEVTGTPQLALDVGGVTRQARYTDGTGDQLLTFSYKVAEGDSDADGVEIKANSVTIRSGSSIRADGMDVPLQHDAVPANDGHQVNT